MKEFFKKNKKALIIVGIVTAVFVPAGVVLFFVMRKNNQIADVAEVATDEMGEVSVAE